VSLRSERGRIYDRDMRVLVRNEPGFVLVVDPNAWFQNNLTPEDSPESRRARLEVVLATLFPKEWAERTPPTIAALEGAGRRRTADGLSRFATIDLVPWISPERERELRLHGLPGVGFHPTTRRRAIDGLHASAVLGHVSRFGVGLEGLEYRWDATLAGTPRVVRRKSDLKGVVPGSEQEIRPGVPGQDLVLTIDSTLQHEVEAELARAVAEHKAEAGTAVVLDAASGDILAMAGCPTFDVNTPGTVPADHRRIAGAQWVFEPGSTMKSITLAAALEAGTVVPSDTFTCTGRLPIGRRKVSCDPHGAFQHGHGTQTVKGVLTHSCNVATARIALAMGPDRMARTMHDFGFGASTRSGLPGEESGLVRNDWSKIRTATVGFGQGVSVTPLQMAAAYTTFVDGVRRSPRIVRGVRDPRTGDVRPIPAEPAVRVLSERSAATVRDMLENVVVEGTGTAAALDRYAVGGKTGTAQIPGKGGYANGQFFASF
ncbi:MAG: peptidoglycan D,D-transpeptidase FtsI family protein, partial [Armatimonadota bacterium]